MSRIQSELTRRKSAASLLQLALRELRELNNALDDGSVSRARVHALELADALELVEERVGVVTPASLFDEE